MRHALLLSLAALAAAGEPELSPPGGDWEALKPDADEVKARFRTEFADADPEAYAEVRVMTYALSEALAKKGLDAIAHDWAPTVESRVRGTVEEGKSTLGPEEAWVRDVRADATRLTWHLARRGKLLYVFHVVRTGKATDDAAVEQEILAMRTAFRLPDKPAEPPPEPPPVEDEPRETLTFDHWRFECVKPLGLSNVPPEKLDDAERKSGVVAKFQGKGEQTMITVRFYAATRMSQRFTLEQLAAQRLKQFEESYPAGSRLPARRDDGWKCPLAERTIALELTGRKAAVQTRRWYLAQCRNDRQYQIEILVAGDGDWDAAIRELVEGFRPLRDQ